MCLEDSSWSGSYTRGDQKETEQFLYLVQSWTEYIENWCINGAVKIRCVNLLYTTISVSMGNSRSCVVFSRVRLTISERICNQCSTKYFPKYTHIYLYRFKCRNSVVDNNVT